MANEKQQAESKPNPELDEMAFTIFTQAVARSPNARGGDTVARAAYQKAKAFLAVRNSIHSGEATDTPEGKQFDGCFAPNLPPTHPVNLVSEKFGDQQKINRVAQFLRENPTVSTEEEQERLVSRLKQKFPDLMTLDHNRSIVPWDLPTINTARVILPEYATN